MPADARLVARRQVPAAGGVRGGFADHLRADIDPHRGAGRGAAREAHGAGVVVVDHVEAEALLARSGGSAGGSGARIARPARRCRPAGSVATRRARRPAEAAWRAGRNSRRSLPLDAPAVWFAPPLPSEAIAEAALPGGSGTTSSTVSSPSTVSPPGARARRKSSRAPGARGSFGRITHSPRPSARVRPSSRWPSSKITSAPAGGAAGRHQHAAGADPRDVEPGNIRAPGGWWRRPAVALLGRVPRPRNGRPEAPRRAGADASVGKASGSTIHDVPIAAAAIRAMSPILCASIASSITVVRVLQPGRGRAIEGGRPGRTTSRRCETCRPAGRANSARVPQHSGTPQ